MDKRKTIVLVDNDRAFRRRWARILRGDGFEVLEASSEEAAKELFKGTVDLAIVDLRLEHDRDENDVSGLALAAEADRSSIPVIILTGVEKAKVEKALKAFQREGRISVAVEVLGKEEEPEAFLEIVHNKMVIIPKIFLVHGRDKNARKAVVQCLKGFQVTVLKDMPGGAMSIMGKIDKFANAHFAVILVTPDDFGGLRANPEKQRARARQNVIFEYGWFLGKFGAGHVVALHSEEEFELPSDLEGIHHILMDPDGHWKKMLLKELKTALDLVQLSR
ncbi:MAG: TIR domain-containing protein [Thermoanaerobaculia bacterium]